MTDVALVGVPAAPMLLASVSPHPPADVAADLDELRRATAQVLTAPWSGPTIVAVAGTSLGLKVAHSASLGSFGHPQTQAALSAPEVAGDLAARCGVDLDRVDELHGEEAVLAIQVASHASADEPGAQVVALSVPTAADAVDAAVAAITSWPCRLVAAGDLAATLTEDSPGHLVDGAARWEADAVAAIRGVDVAAFEALGPERADAVQARGWAPLRLLLRVAATTGQRPETLVHRQARGVGQLVVRLAP